MAILASGTASLEAALLQVPHVVVYRLSGFSHWLMRRLRQVDHFAMPNHLLPTAQGARIDPARRQPRINIVEAVDPLTCKIPNVCSELQIRLRQAIHHDTAPWMRTDWRPDVVAGLT